MKMADAMALAGGPGAIILPLVGYLTAWVQVHGAQEYKDCLCKEKQTCEVPDATGKPTANWGETHNYLRWTHSSSQLWFYGYVLIYFLVLIRHGTKNF